MFSTEGDLEGIPVVFSLSVRRNHRGSQVWRFMFSRPYT